MSASSDDFQGTPAGSEHTPHFPGRAPIDAYGNGGFRFADMSHRGSILCLPSGIYAWAPRTIADVTPPSLARVLAEKAGIAVFLLGAGATHSFPPRTLKDAIESAGIAFESMTTGAAARTYNILLAEQRSVAAALLTVD
jgi:uncharacterized protein